MEECRLFILARGSRLWLLFRLITHSIGSFLSRSMFRPNLPLKLWPEILENFKIRAASTDAAGARSRTQLGANVYEGGFQFLRVSTNVVAACIESILLIHFSDIRPPSDDIHPCVDYPLPSNPVCASAHIRRRTRRLR
jgi:hypothetical protein